MTAKKQKISAFIPYYTHGLIGKECKRWIDDYSYKVGYADGYKDCQRHQEKGLEKPDKGDLDGRD